MLADSISPNQYKTLFDILAARALQSPKRVAYRYFDEANNTWRTVTWVEMLKRVFVWKRWLLRYPRGCSVALMLNNHPDWIACEQAALSLGLVVVPISPSERASRIEYFIRNSESQALVVESVEKYSTLVASLPNLPENLEVVCRDSSSSDGIRVIRAVQSTGSAQNAQIDVSPISPHQLATIVYTSGTSGTPKGVMLSHRNIIAALRNAQTQIPVMADDVFFSTQSLATITERTMVCYLAMIYGTTLVFPRALEINTIIEDMRAQKPTIVIGTPYFFDYCLDGAASRVRFSSWVKRLIAANRHRESIGLGRRRCSAFVAWLLGGELGRLFGGKLRIAISGSAPLSLTTSLVYRACGYPLFQGYGQTEASPLISLNTKLSGDALSVGEACGVETKLLPDGELCIRGENVMMGYWRKQESPIDSDGWMHTGDLVRLSNGELFITGRKHNTLVMASGEKYSTDAIKLAVLSDPLFVDVSLIGHEAAVLKAVLSVREDLWDVFVRSLKLDPEEKNIQFHPKVKRAILTKVNVQLCRDLSGAKIHDVQIALAETRREKQAQVETEPA